MVVASNVYNVSLFQFKQNAVKFTLKCWRQVSFEFLVSMFVVIINKFVRFVVVVCSVHNNSHSSFVRRQYYNVFVGFQSFQCLSFVISQVVG